MTHSFSLDQVSNSNLREFHLTPTSPLKFSAMDLIVDNVTDFLRVCIQVIQ